MHNGKIANIIIKHKSNKYKKRLSMSGKWLAYRGLVKLLKMPHIILVTYLIDPIVT